MRLKARLYDAFLEGQFRHSALRDHWRELNPLLGQAWAGLEYRSPSGLVIRYLVRWQSPELRSGVGSRELLWGSVGRPPLWRPVAAMAAQPAGGNLERPRLAMHGAPAAAAARKCARRAVQNG